MSRSGSVEKARRGIGGSLSRPRPDIQLNDKLGISMVNHVV
jgi:hypothetical protein